MTQPEWDQIVASFADAVFDQTWACGAACWGVDRLSHLVVRAGDDIVAACQVVSLTPPLLASGIAHVKFGPLWQPRGVPADRASLRRILTGLRDEYVTKRGLYLRVMPPVAPTDNATLGNHYTDLGFVQRDIPDADRYLVDLAQPLANIRAGLKSKWRYHLKKAEQQDLVISRNDDHKSVSEFLDLYASMRTRKHFADSTALAQLQTIHASLPPDLQLSVWLCRQGAQPVAGAIVSAVGDFAQYLFGASNDRGRELRAGYRLQWEIVRWLQTTGCQWYDLGGGCENDGLIQFKSGMVGKTGRRPALPGYFDLSGGTVSALIANGVFGLRDRLGPAWQRFIRTKRPKDR